MLLITLLICSIFSYDELHTIDPARDPALGSHTGSRGFFQVTTGFFQHWPQFTTFVVPLFHYFRSETIFTMQ